MEALFNFREWLLELRENDSNRLPVRRNGNAKQRDDGSRVYGPFKLDVRKEILARLRALAKQVGAPLILPAEVECIEEVWWRDAIRENARQALDRSILATAGSALPSTP